MYYDMQVMSMGCKICVCVCVQACKWHSGRESFGQRWSAGDVVGCLLDMDAGQVAFTLNRDLLQDSLGSTVAFEGVRGVGLVPVVTMAAGQRAQLNFGRSKVKLYVQCTTHMYVCPCKKIGMHSWGSKIG